MIASFVKAIQLLQSRAILLQELKMSLSGNVIEVLLQGLDGNMLRPEFEERPGMYVELSVGIGSVLCE